MKSNFSSDNFEINEPKYDLFRCSKCYNIQYIETFIKDNEIYLSLKCENKHNNELPLKNALEKRLENQIENVLCSSCGVSSSIIEFYYCYKHNIFFCANCSNSHSSCGQLISLDNFDNYCKKHSKQNFFFCQDCGKEICYECIKTQHNIHSYKSIIALHKTFIEKYRNQIISTTNDLNNFNQKMKEKIESFENSIRQLKKIKENCIHLTHLQIYLSKLLLNVYEKKQSQQKISYPVIENLRKFKFINLMSDYGKIFETFPLTFSKNKEDSHSKTNSSTQFESSLNSEEIINNSKKILYLNEENKYFQLKNKKELKDTEINPLKKNNYCFKNRDNTNIISRKGIVITSLIFTNDNQLLSGDENGKITLYSDKFSVLNSFSPHKKSINYFFKLKSGKILVSSADSHLSIICVNNNIALELKSFIKGHTDGVLQAIEFSNNLIYSCSLDKSIRIWENFEKEKYKEINKKILGDKGINGFVEVNEQIIGTKFFSETLVFLNKKTLELNDEIPNIKCGSLPSSIILINNDLLAIGGEGLYIIKISQKKIINYIESPYIYFKCLFFDKDSNEIIIGLENGEFSSYNINTKQYEVIKKKDNCHGDVIYCIVKSNTNIIASSAKDIRTWEII